MARLSNVTAIVSDFGGVLTSPLLDSFTALQERSGIPLEALGHAMAALAQRNGTNPLFELETGRMTEASFLDALAGELSAQLGREVEMADFGERLFAGLRPNHQLIDYMRGLRGRGFRMAICTNNVREWESRWRAMLPVDEIFDVIVDSAFVGVRKPEPAIYELTLQRLAVAARHTLLVDDVELNCQAARELGMTAVWFRDNEQAIRDIEAALVATT